jgi:NDP-sugar pyrophosphorylase family protein
MTLPVAILAGGLATRMRPITATIPKSLIEVNGRPFAEHQIRLLKSHGVTRLVYCIGFLGEQVVEALGDGSRYGVTIEYVFDGPALQGTGGAVRNALPHLGDAFLVLYGDAYLECDYQDISRTFLESGKDALMTVYRNQNAWDTSNVLFRDGALVEYNKKKPTAEMEHLDYGLLAFRRWVFDEFPDTPLDLATVQASLVRQGRVVGYEVHRRFYEIGSPTGLADISAYLAQQGLE